MSSSFSSYGTAPTAQNGLGYNIAGSAIELGGDLIRPTQLNTSPLNTFALTGLVAGNPATDTLLVADPAGAIRFLNITGLNDFWRSGTGATTPDGTNDETEDISRVGNVGIGFVDTTLIRSRLDVNGAQILRPVTIANLPAGGVIGTSAATVDIASTIILSQTTANQAIKLPNPTNTQSGRLLFVTHNGNVATTVNAKPISASETLVFVWDGNTWNGNASPQVADFWRTITNTFPDGTNDTTESIRRLGHIGIGGALITDGMPTVTTPTATNNFLHLSNSATNRGQLMFGSTPLSYYLTRTLPTVVNDYVQLGTLTGTAGAHPIRLSLSVNNGGFATTKTYVVSPQYNFTAGAWRVVRPLTDGGAYAGNNYELLMSVSNDNILFRIRRTLGATVGTVRVRLEYLGDESTTFTEQNAVGTDATVLTMYEPFPFGIGQGWIITGNSGTTPSAYNNNGAQANNFLGTLDNQALSFYTNANSVNAKSDMRLYTTTASGAGIDASTDIFHIRRGGQNGISHPQIFTLALGKWFADVNSRTRVDFKLANGAAVTDITVMSLFSSGHVGIGPNGVFSWNTATNGLSKNNVGNAMLRLDGANGSTAGPHFQTTTATDNYPLLTLFSWTHNNNGLIFDGYYDGTWRAAHTTRPYSIYKSSDSLVFQGSSAVPAAAGNAWTLDPIMTLRHSGATAGGGELWFNNVVKNRRIVLFDANAASDHQFYGFGINGGILRYQVTDTASHVFYVAVNATTSTEIMRVNAAGLTLQVGNGFKPGGGAWAAVSDKRVKKHVKKVTGGLDEVLALNPITFEYNGKAGTIEDNTTHYSLIAQEVEKVAKDFVGITEITDEIYDAMSDSDKKLFSDRKLYHLPEGISRFDALFINAIKELNNKLERIVNGK